MTRMPKSVVFLLFLLLGGCDSSFDPKGPFLDRMVVFGVITPKTQAHVVRLSSTYDPPALNPLDNTSSKQTINAIVSLAFDTNTVALRDTVLPRDDTNRYTDSIRAFVASPLSIFRGTTYTLTVNSPIYGILTASTRIPGTGLIEIDFDSRFSLVTPDQGRADISIFTTPSSTTEGHAIKIFVEYELPVANPGVIFTEEIPLDITDYQDCTHFKVQYPRVRRRELVGGRELWKFRLENYRRTLVKILKTNEGSVVAFKRVYVELIQTDEHLYKYYSVVNGFQDQFSIRVDQPNYTNVAGGLGVFGSYTSDTTIVAATLPPTFPNLSCIN